MTNHAYKEFDTELESLKVRVMDMGIIVERQIIDAVESLMTGNLKLATQAMADDITTDSFEMNLDEECSLMIVRHQPVGEDLRNIMMMIKVIADLERIGDEASKIARKVHLLHRKNLKCFQQIKQMGDLVLDMLCRSLHVFSHNDLSIVPDIIRQDDIVDEEFRSIIRQLMTFMFEDPRIISMSLEVLFIAKSLERIGDHAKSIAEHVVYTVKGRNITHLSIEEIKL